MGVRIAEIGPEHAPEVQALASDPAILRTTQLPSPYPPDGAQSFIRDAIDGRRAGTTFVFVMMDGEVLVGTCGFKDVTGSPKEAEAGYWVGKPYWGRGYASAAVGLLLEFGFGELELSKVRACCLTINARSLRVSEKSGFARTQVNTEASGGHWEPTDRFAHFELYRSAWLKAECG